MEVQAPIALFPASVGDVAREMGKTLGPDLVPALTEAVRRLQLGRYLSEEETMRETGLSKRQLRYLREKRRLPFVKHGRIVLYPATDLFAWLDAGRVDIKATTSA